MNYKGLLVWVVRKCFCSTLDSKRRFKKKKKMNKNLKSHQVGHK